ncbi:MAG: hypothetical protein K9L64_02715 [Candidatus Izimaplasma sp.]|nr:hypothetical protein [Candidatus Izimaplasma bacterium]
MKFKYLFFIPLLMILISIATSIIAFKYSKTLEQGYVKINQQETEVVFDGEYFVVLGNISDLEKYIEVESTNDFIQITTYDEENNIVKDFHLTIKEKDKPYDASIIIETLSDDLILIDEMEDYLFYVGLEENKIYEFSMTQTVSNNDDQYLDLVLVNLPEHLYNMKNLNEGISFTTLVFAVISGLSLLGIAYVKKED